MAQADVRELIPIYTAANWGYRGPLAVMLASLDGNVSGQVGRRVFVLTPPDDVPKFRADFDIGLLNLRLEFVAIETQEIERLPIYGHTGLMTYARLLLEDERLCPYDHILYLDADILVRTSVTPLFASVDAQKTALAGVQECGAPTVADVGGVFNWREEGLDPRQPYINAGVLGLRMDLVREQRYFSRALDYLAIHGHRVASWDQGAINAIAGGDVSLLSEKYNYTTSYLDALRRKRYERITGRTCCADEEVCIVHFTGSGVSKPWQPNTTSPFAEEYRLWMANYATGLEFPSQRTRLEAWLGVALARLVRSGAKLVARFRAWWSTA